MSGGICDVGCFEPQPFSFLINLDQQIAQHVSWRVEVLVAH
jgi:hypothetical protein